jgi:hypothetical protein
MKRNPEHLPCRQIYKKDKKDYPLTPVTQDCREAFCLWKRETLKQTHSIPATLANVWKHEDSRSVDIECTNLIRKRREKGNVVDTRPVEALAR